MKPLLRAIVSPALLLLATTVQAVPVNLTTGLTTADVTLDFNDLASGDVSNQYASQGVTFSGAPGTVSRSTIAYAGFSGAHLAEGGSSVPPTPISNALDIQFSGPVNAAAFRLVTNPGTSTFIALLGGSTVEQYTATSNLSTGTKWFGFEGISFDTLRLEPGGTNGATHIDDLQFSGFAATAPEPETVLLLGLGLAALGLHRRRS